MKTHPHETTVCATFKDALMAQKALQALEPMHLDEKDVSLITTEDAYQRYDANISERWRTPSRLARTRRR